MTHTADHQPDLRFLFFRFDIITVVVEVSGRRELLLSWYFRSRGTKVGEPNWINREENLAPWRDSGD